MLHVVVPCVGTKTLPNGPTIRDAADRIQPEGARGDVTALFEEWRRLIEERLRTGPTVPATQLYSGDLWRRCMEACRSFGTPHRLWVASAGLGLLTGATPVCAYDATFSHVESPAAVYQQGAPREESRLGPTAFKREWWRLLTEWTPHAWSHPRSLAALQQSLRKDDSLIIVMGTAYMTALRPDIGRLQASNVTIGGTPTACYRVPPRLRSRAVRVRPKNNWKAPAEVLEEIARSWRRPAPPRP